MDSRIPRPVDSRRTTNAATRHHIAATGSQTAEMSTSAPGRPHPRDAPMATHPSVAICHGRVAVSGPRRSSTKTNTTTTCSRPAQALQSSETANYRAAGPAARNFSRVQPAGSAAPNAARPNAGIENWGCRLESVQALPLHNRGIVRSYGRGTPSLIREDDESGLLSAQPSTRSTLTASERHAAVVRVDENRARRQPVQVHAAPIHSRAASLVAATKRGPSRASAVSREAVRFSPMRPRQNQSPLPPSPLRNVLASASESALPRTYLDLQSTVERSSTRLPPKIGAPVGWGGPNYSPYAAGTTMADLCRRKELARKFPLPANAVGDDARERKFVSGGGPWVDVPVLGRRAFVQECEVRLTSHRRTEEAEEVRKAVVAAQAGEKTAEKKKGALSRLGRFLVHGSRSSGTPSPPTPVQRRPEPTVVVVGAPAPRQAVPPTVHQGDTRRFVSQTAVPSPARHVHQQGSTRVSPARARNNDALAQAAAVASALSLQRIPYDQSLGYHSEHWARAESSGAAALREEAFHSALAGFFAQQEAAANQPGRTS